MNEATSRVAIYARVSTDGQADSGTIKSQVTELLERVRQDGLEVADAMRFVDDGYSGTTEERPGLEKLRDAAYVGEIDVLYIHSPDRLARVLAIQLVVLEELQSAGVEIRFLNTIFEDGPEGVLRLHMQGVFAEYERTKILERGRRGRIHAARRGSVTVIGRSPFGYEYVREPGSREAEFRIVVDEANTVRQIFHWYAVERVSLREIRTRLKDLGIKSPTGKATWPRATLLSLLKNTTYRGSAAYGKTRREAYKGRRRRRRGDPEFPKRRQTIHHNSQKDWIEIPVPAIVSDDLFDEAQERVTENRRKAERQKRSEHLLQGLIVCETCGYAMVGMRPKRTSAYSCYRCLGSQPRRFGGERVCPRTSVRGAALEQAVWDDVCNFLQDPSRVQSEYESRLQCASDADRADVRGLARRIRGLQQSRERVLDIYQEGRMHKDEFNERYDVIMKKIELAKTQLDAARQDESARAELRLTMMSVQEFTEKLRRGLSDATWETKRAVIHALVKQIAVGEKEIQVVYLVDPAAVADTHPPEGVKPGLALPSASPPTSASSACLCP